MWQMRQNFVAQLIQLLKHWLYNMWSDVVMEKTLAPSIDQCRLQGQQFMVRLINLLIILPRCNGFTRIQKTVADQTGSRPPGSDHCLFWCKFGFGKCFGASRSNLRAGHHWLSYTIHFLLRITIQLRNGSLLCRIREDTSERRFFQRLVSS